MEKFIRTKVERTTILSDKSVMNEKEEANFDRIVGELVADKSVEERKCT